MQRATSRLVPIVLAIVAALAAAPSVRADDALYRDLGQRATIAKFVDRAMTRWLADPRIAATFDNLNLDRFKQRLTDQLCELAGGPCHYTGRDMYQSHKGLHLDIVQFNALVEGLEDAMDSADIPFRAQNRLLAMLAPMKRDIVTR